jgi:hypothetical protein
MQAGKATGSHPKSNWLNSFAAMKRPVGKPGVFTHELFGGLEVFKSLAFRWNQRNRFGRKIPYSCSIGHPTVPLQPTMEFDC